MKNIECCEDAKKAFGGNGVHLFAYLRGFLSLLTVFVEKMAQLPWPRATWPPVTRYFSLELLPLRAEMAQFHCYINPNRSYVQLDYSSPYLKSTNKGWILPLSPASNKWTKIHVNRDTTLSYWVSSEWALVVKEPIIHRGSITYSQYWSLQQNCLRKSRLAMYGLLEY